MGPRYISAEALIGCANPDARAALLDALNDPRSGWSFVPDIDAWTDRPGEVRRRLGKTAD